jgi:putative ABC transport system substrate-binding protein
MQFDQLKRREFITLLGGAAAWPLGARAQQAGKIWRVGMLDNTSPSLNAANVDAFRQGMRELGYVEGQNLLIEYRSVDGRNERYPEMAADLVRLKVDVIVTRGTPALLAAKSATAAIPIVMAAIAEPPASVIASLAHPGGNVTGLSSFTSELEPKRVELIKEIVPGIARIAVMYNMENPVFLARWQQMEQVARSVGFQPQLLDVRRPEDLKPAFDAAMTQRADAMVVSNDSLTVANRKIFG